MKRSKEIVRKAGRDKRRRPFAAMMSIALVLTACPEIPETLCVLAAAYTEENAPSMTVKMKGQYSGSRTFYCIASKNEQDNFKQDTIVQ